MNLGQEWDLRSRQVFNHVVVIYGQPGLRPWILFLGHENWLCRPLRQGAIPITTLINSSSEGDRRHKSPTAATKPVEKGKKAEKQPAIPAEIWARDGEGPYDWLSLAKRLMVPLNLVDLWQISPECAKQFRHLSSRKRAASAKSKGKKRAKASIPTRGCHEIGGLPFSMNPRAQRNTRLMARSQHAGSDCHQPFLLALLTMEPAQHIKRGKYYRGISALSRDYRGQPRWRPGHSIVIPHPAPANQGCRTR